MTAKFCVLGLAILLVTSHGWAQELTRQDVQRLIREAITDVEFERMRQLKGSTGQSWADIYDNIIEPEREQEQVENKSQRRYIIPSDNPRAKRGGRSDVRSANVSSPQLAIDVNAVPMEGDLNEGPVTVVDDSQSRKRQRIYSQESGPPETQLPEKLRRDPNNLPATSIRSRLKAARDAGEEADSRSNSFERRSRLYKASGRRDNSTEDEPEEGAAEEEKSFGANVLGQHENKMFGTDKDRFEKFGNKKPIERKIFRSGTVGNNDRKTSMFGKDEENK